MEIFLLILLLFSVLLRFYHTESYNDKYAGLSFRGGICKQGEVQGLYHSLGRSYAIMVSLTD